MLTAAARVQPAGADTAFVVSAAIVATSKLPVVLRVVSEGLTVLLDDVATDPSWTRLMAALAADGGRPIRMISTTTLTATSRAL